MTTALTVQKPGIAGLTPTYSAADATGNTFPNDGNTIVHIKNGGGSSITVTLPTPGKVAGVDIADPTVSIGAGAEKFIGPFDPRAFAQSDGSVLVNYSGVTTVTVAALSAVL